ncbi:hypothetical protein [Mycolicibacterium sp. A43C]
MPELYVEMMREASTRTCPVCKQLVHPTPGSRDETPSVQQHADTTKASICPMSGQPFELTYAVQGAVSAAQVVA